MSAPIDNKKGSAMQSLRLLTNLICKFKVGKLHKQKAPSGRELAREARLKENAAL